MKWIANASGNGNWAKTARSIFVLCATTAIALPAQVLTTVHNFDGTDGAFPYYGALVQATNGYLYGTTGNGGSANQGTAFRMTPSGALTSLQSFCGTAASGCVAGQLPEAGLVQATLRQPLWDNRWGRDQQPRYGIQNYPQRHADNAVQFLCPERVCRRPRSLLNANSDHQRGPQWDNRRGRCERTRHNLQNHPSWHADDGI